MESRRILAVTIAAIGLTIVAGKRNIPAPILLAAVGVAAPSCSRLRSGSRRVHAAARRRHAMAIRRPDLDTSDEARSRRIIRETTARAIENLRGDVIDDAEADRLGRP